MSNVHMASTIVSILFFNLLFSGSVMRKVHCDRLRVNNTSSNFVVSSIQSVYGDIYDCVDVYKQPSLSHPALRGHKIKMRPGREILATLGYNVSKNKNNLAEFNFWKSKKGCPKGTVPIQRTKMMNNKKNYSRDSLSHSLNWNHGIDFAGIYSKSGQMFYGASALINIYNPKVHGPNQYSSATIFLEWRKPNSSRLDDFDQVNPQLYGDYRTRMYASWTSDSHRSTGCYNTQCPGFVMVSNKIPLGFVFDDISVIEGKQYEEYFYMHLEPGVGWWLHVRDVLGAIGYWPTSLFSTMQQSATSFRCGGEVFTPLSDDNSPEMGSGGKFVNGQYDKTCYMRQVSIRQKDYQFVDVDNSYMEETDSRCYYAGDNSFKNEENRYSFVFGGKGGTDERTCVY